MIKFCILFLALALSCQSPKTYTYSIEVLDGNQIKVVYWSNMSDKELADLETQIKMWGRDKYQEEFEVEFEKAHRGW